MLRSVRTLGMSVAIWLNAKPHSGPLNHGAIHQFAVANRFAELPIANGPLVTDSDFLINRTTIINLLQCYLLRFIQRPSVLANFWHVVFPRRSECSAMGLVRSPCRRI